MLDVLLSGAELLCDRLTDTAGTSVASSKFTAVEGKKNYVTAVHCFNNSATPSYIDFRDGTGGAILYSLLLPAGGGAVLPSSRVPYFKTSANTALAYDVSGAITTVFINVSGVQAL